MFNKIRKFLKNKEQVLDTANMILGLLMLTALVVFWKTGNRWSMFTVIFSGAAMNAAGGYRYLMQKKHKQMGYSMLLLGIVILILGTVLVIYGF